jgi:hypothetical protein
MAKPVPTHLYTPVQLGAVLWIWFALMLVLVRRTVARPLGQGAVDATLAGELSGAARGSARVETVPPLLTALID